ncbi:MAG: hypothetical protein AB7F88_01725 [Pyrinomonadaceae bacterium]
MNGAIEPSFCIGTAWEMVQRRFGLYVGSCVVMLLIMTFAGIIPFANLILDGPMVGGFTYLVLKDLRGDPVEFSMLFHGFKRFVKLMVIGLVQGIPGIIYQVVQLVMTVQDLFRQSATADPNFFQAEPVNDALGAGWIAFAPMLIGYFFFSIIWNMVLMFAIPLIVEHDLEILQTIKLSFAAVFNNIGGMIHLFVLGTLVALLGMIVLCIGLLVAIPVIWAANVIAYKQVFPLPGETLFTGPSSKGGILNLNAD